MKDVIEAYYAGRLHESLLLIRSDLRMSDIGNALIKLNDLIKFIEEKVTTIIEEDKNALPLPDVPQF